MSWAEFILRSIGFKEEREFQMLMTREVAYQSYCAQFIYSKKKPMKKDLFWKIGKDKSKNTIDNLSKEAYFNSVQEYLREKNG